VTDENLASIAQPNPPAAKERLKIAKGEIAIDGGTKCPCTEIQPSDYTEQEGHSGRFNPGTT